MTAGWRISSRRFQHVPDRQPCSHEAEYAGLDAILARLDADDLAANQ
jgi:hypothetical protein